MTSLPAALLQWPLLFIVGLFVSLLLGVELGRWLRRRRRGGVGGEAPGVGLIEGAVFALLGLMIAFTFSASAGRFEHRRALIVDETNMIGTALLRVDLLPADAQPSVRDAFRRYIQSRRDTYALVYDPTAFVRELKRSNTIQMEIWSLAAAAGRRPDSLPAANMLLLPALNEMFDITTTRTAALLTHTPTVIYLVLWCSALIASVLAGAAMAATSNRSWLQVLSFAAVVTISIYVLVDMEYPRLGLIRVDGFEQSLLQVLR